MGILDPSAALRFGPPRQAGFATPGTQAPPMPGPGFSPLLGPAPGASPNALPRQFSGGLRDRVSGFAGNHPIIADNSSMLLQMGLGLLSGGGNPNRSWAAAQQGAMYGQQADSQRRATSQAEQKAAQDAEEYSALLHEMGLAPDELQILEMMDPASAMPFLLERLGPQAGPVWVDAVGPNGVVGQTNTETGQFVAHPDFAQAQDAADPDLPDDWELFQLVHPGGDGQLYNQWNLERLGRAGGVPDQTQQLRTALVAGEAATWNAFSNQASVAGNVLAEVEVLRELSAMAPDDPITGYLVTRFPGFDNAGDAFRALVLSIAPSLRVEGSGSTSDLEYIGMVNSFGSLTMHDETRQAVLSVMQAKAEIDLERADVVTRFMNNSIDEVEARAELAALNRRSIMTDEVRNILGVVVIPPMSASAMDEGMTEEEWREIFLSGRASLWP